MGKEAGVLLSSLVSMIKIYQSDSCLKVQVPSTSNITLVVLFLKFNYFNFAETYCPISFNILSERE